MTYTLPGPLNVASQLPPVPIVDANGVRWCACRNHQLEPDLILCPVCKDGAS